MPESRFLLRILVHSPTVGASMVLRAVHRLHKSRDEPTNKTGNAAHGPVISPTQRSGGTAPDGRRRTYGSRLDEPRTRKPSPHGSSGPALRHSSPCIPGRPFGTVQAVQGE